MKIVVDARLAFAREKTGIEGYVAAIIREWQALAKKSPEKFAGVHIVLYADRRAREFIGDASFGDAFEVKYVSSALTSQPSWFFILHKEKPDVFWGPSGLPLVFLFLFFPRIKKIATSHGIAFAHNPHAYAFLHLLRFMLITFTSAKRSHKIIAVSHHVKGELANRYHLHPDRIVVIHNGVHTENSAAVARDVPARENILRAKKNYIVYLGRMAKEKNIALLIAGYQALPADVLPDLKLVLCGPVQDEDFAGSAADAITHLPDVAALEAALSVSGRKIFHIPHTDGAEKTRLIMEAQALVMPAHYEGFGIATGEAQALMTPVIAADIPTNHEVAGESALFFDPRDAAALAAAIQTLLSDQVFYNRMAHQGYENSKRFSWAHTALATLDMLIAAAKTR